MSIVVACESILIDEGDDYDGDGNDCYLDHDGLPG
jgi:hypothetical protein